MKSKYCKIHDNIEPRQTKVLNNVVCKVQRLDVEDKTTNKTSRRCPSNILEDDIVRYPTKVGDFHKSIKNNNLWQLPIIAAILPSLALNELAMVTALDRRVGSVFYLDAVYGSTKGAITAGDTLSNAQTGHDRTISGRRYASDMVRQEPIVVGGNPITGTGAVSYTVAYAATAGIKLTETGNVIIRDSAGTIVGIDSTTPGTIVPVAGGLVTISAGGTLTANGVLSFTVASGTDSGGLTVDYWYIYDKPADAYGNKTGVPELDIDMRSETVTAHDFPIRSKFSVGAGIDLQKSHGVNFAPLYGNVYRKVA